MHSIEKEYRTNRLSLRSHLGSGLATLAVFAAIASTSQQIGKLTETKEEKRPIYYLAPPKDFVESRSSSSKAAEEIETFAVDTIMDMPTEELQFDNIDVSISSDIDSGFSLDLEMKRKFSATAPNMDSIPQFTIYDQSEVDEVPVIRYARTPDVPYRLRGESVEVTLFYYVDETGKTDQPSILDSTSENPAYAQIAAETIRKWRFRPALKNRKPVPCWVQQTIVFNEGSTSPFSL